MSDAKTNVTELATALGILDIPVKSVAANQLPPIVGVDLRAWGSAVEAAEGGTHADLFAMAHENGRHFFRAVDGLNNRKPRLVQWKGPHKAVGDEATPADLRIDHVYLISCKYENKVLHNSSPGALFNRLLTGGQGKRTNTDWFMEVAPLEYQAYYEQAVSLLEASDFPPLVSDLQKTHRETLKGLGRLSSPDLSAAAGEFHSQVAHRSSQRWTENIRANTDNRMMLWRLLRIGSAPYFILGAVPGAALRLRVSTPWDWVQRYDLRSFVVSPKIGGQSMVAWEAVYDDRMTSTRNTVAGHVEIRWSHGKFGGPPEAKVYLDTPVKDVPGYFHL